MNLFNKLRVILRIISQLKIKVYEKELIINYRSTTLVIGEEDFYLDVKRDVTVDCKGYMSLCPPEGFNVREEQEKLKEDAQHLHQREGRQETQRACCRV